ncbi:MAG TPA: hypothetical protein VIN08_28405 [Ohtaekwangia sp.]|uniref:Spy/CpxP family protein refolding chaperone n=1 Tax=Ohtaekwangia sp. TaxID=2066019 RepID=UPI002F929C25
MKKSIVLVVVMMVSTIIFAQRNGKPHHKHNGDELEKMKTELSLNDKQYATIKGIGDKYSEKFKALRKDSTQAREKKFVALRSLREEKDKEVTAVLTSEQKAKWDTYKADRAAKKKEERKQAAEKRAQKMKTALSLSDDQFAKIQAENKSFKEKVQTLKQSKDASAKPDESKFKAIMDEHDAHVKAILTPEQYQKWSSMKKDMYKKHGKGHERKSK